MDVTQRVLKAVVVVLGATTLVCVFRLGGGQNLQGFDWRLTLGLTAWWLSALAVYWVFCATVLGAGVVGGGYLIAIIAALLSIYRSESSTAAIGLFTIPVLLWIGVIFGVLLETGLRWISWRHRG